MPELPDVEAFRRIAADHATGRVVTDVREGDGRTGRRVHAAELRAALRGRKVAGVTRHGKWLTVTTAGPSVLIHFGMTGALRWADDEWRDDDRLAVVFAAGELRLADRRNLSTVALVAAGDDPTGVTGPLGPDAASVSRLELGAALARSRAGLKATLLDQRVVAGLGNMLTDEILWCARLDPLRAAAGLDEIEQARLLRAVRRVVSRTSAAGHIPRGPTWLTGQRDADEPRCPRCGGSLGWRRAASRSSLWCPHCQR